MRALKVFTGHMIFKLRYNQIYQLKTTLKAVGNFRQLNFDYALLCLHGKNSKKVVRDHSFKTSACLRGGGVSPCADGPKVTVHKDQKFPS